MNTYRLLTPPGVAAVAVVRLEGPAVASFLAEHFDGPPGDVSYGKLRAGGERIDDPLVHRSESRADLNLHGSPWIVTRVIRLAEACGFSVGAEAVGEACELLWNRIEQLLPHATGPLAVRLLLAQRKLWREGSAKIAADDAIGHLILPPTVAIVGPPNVGKSTLANRLFATDRSIVADEPGTTRDYVGELADIDGLVVRLIDTPGRRATDDAIEAAAIRASEATTDRADLRLHVRDATSFELPIHDGPGDWTVWNKCDRSGESGPGHISAARGDGVAELRADIVRHFLGDDPTRSRFRLP